MARAASKAAADDLLAGERAILTGSLQAGEGGVELDPQAQQRPLQDTRYALDHFPAKLLKLSDGFQTETGAKLAKERHERLSLFLSLFRDEI